MKYTVLDQMEIGSTNNVKVNTNLWIPLSHHICLTFNTLVHIIGDGTRRSPFMLLQKGADQDMEVKGLCLATFKKQGWWESWSMDVWYAARHWII